MSPVKMIVGLGNPGRDYARTRHNIGFMVIDELARRLSASNLRSRFRAELAEAHVAGEKIILVKPQTYMNLSGTSVREAVRWYKVGTSDLLIVTDDIDLPFGTLRMRASGSSGGHNGLKSIFAEMATQDVNRLRIGVGRGPGDATRQVLTRFSPEEARQLPEIIGAAVDCTLSWERDGIINAMNRCNRRTGQEPATVAETESHPTSGSEPSVGLGSSSPASAAVRELDTRPAQSAITGAYKRLQSLWKKDGN